VCGHPAASRRPIHENRHIQKAIFMKKAPTKAKVRHSTARPAGELNATQQQAVRHGPSPLLIIAGAGTGKTLTLAHRAAHLIAEGVPPHRILLLTFTRRAAESMLHRVQTIRSHSPVKKPKGGNDAMAADKVWGGTFHASGARLIRIHGAAIGVDPRFTIHDQIDAADLLDVIRTELKLVAAGKRV